MRPEYFNPISNYATPAPTLAKKIPTFPSHPDLTVRFGQRTFDAEGQEAMGIHFSRRIHWPGGSSGVTIGRGYDMSQRSQQSVIRDLVQAGLSDAMARSLSLGAGLQGKQAGTFVSDNRENMPILPITVQRRLFEDVVAPEMISDIKRIMTKPDVVRTYGSTSWEQLPVEMQELVFDLRYRGDYSPTTRKRLQPLLVAGDWEGVRDLMKDTTYWRGLKVPEDRIARRIEAVASLPQPYGVVSTSTTEDSSLGQMGAWVTAPYESPMNPAVPSSSLDE